MRTIGDKSRLWVASWEHIVFADSHRAYRLSFLILATIVVLTAYLLFSKSCILQWTMPADSIYLLDYAWRLLNGQRAHADFHDPVGVLYFLTVVLGMKIAGPSGKALVYGPTLVFPVLCAWTWILARRRFVAFDALILSLMVGFLVIGLHPIGMAGFRETSLAMQYNRLGWALFTILAIQLFVSRRNSLSRAETVFEAISAGVLLSLLLFVKINYFTVALFAMLAYGILARPRRIAWIAFTTAFLATFAGILFLFNVDLAGYVLDIRMRASTIEPVTRQIKNLMSMSLDNTTCLFVLFLVTAILSTPFLKADARTERFRWYGTVLVAWTVAFLGLVICEMNMQRTHIPTLPFAALLMCEAFRRRQSSFPAGDPKCDRSPGIRYLAAKLLFVYLLGMILIADVASIGYSARWQHLCSAGNLPSDVHVKSETMRDMLFPPLVGEAADVESAIDALHRGLPFTPYRCAVFVNEGLRLLRPHVGPETRVTTFGVVNPFPFALALPAPRGNQLWWYVGPYVSEESAPAADRLFAEVTHIMVARTPCVISDFMLRTYGPTLNRSFQTLDENRLWTLLKRVDVN